MLILDIIKKFDDYLLIEKDDTISINIRRDDFSSHAIEVELKLVNYEDHFPIRVMSRKLYEPYEYEEPMFPEVLEKDLEFLFRDLIFEAKRIRYGN